ncbi:MAG: hypothetical protein ACI35W_06695 [Anaeroplasmataceae bacterium]
MKEVEKDYDEEFEEEFKEWKEGQQREKAKLQVKNNLAKFEKKRAEMVDMYVETINKYGPEHRVSKIYFSMLKFFEKMYEIVNELVTVQQALLAIDDLNYVMENTFKSLDLVLNSKWNKKRVSGFYRWRQTRKIRKYVKNCYRRLETAQAVGDAMVKSIDGFGFNKSKEQESNVIDENTLNMETRNLIAQSQARYNRSNPSAAEDAINMSNTASAPQNGPSAPNSNGTTISGDAGDNPEI